MAMQNLTLCDQQHSVLASAGAARSYPPYGALAAATVPRLAYCGQAREASTGFYHLGNGYRIYDPCLMRFLSPDALSPFAKGGINAYAYCSGDPINYQDRSGKAKISNGWVPSNGSIRSQLFSGATSFDMNSSTQIYDSSSSSDRVLSNNQIFGAVSSAALDGTLLIKNGGALVNMLRAKFGGGQDGTSPPSWKQIAVTAAATAANAGSLLFTAAGVTSNTETLIIHSDSPPANDVTLATVSTDAMMKGLSKVLSVAAHVQGGDYQLGMFKSDSKASGPDAVPLKRMDLREQV
ncbi:RHS repeat-associated core domain-containing protein [Pseudomonas sp. BJa3]|uniref:RHS repeat-associated core domain-containing protein n=1 Tax=Pseudomonas sp. BJa3 TaxID=2986525 RepID=UPI002265EB47|nr:RHS repeat-associated core domain-containing protein [Pseudomonas sp. BJa3]MCX5509049.1 RHS repeat-associated core domain-containing protein [Pseudomonas sp. BJa3]